MRVTQGHGYEKLRLSNEIQCGKILLVIAKICSQTRPRTTTAGPVAYENVCEKKIADTIEVTTNRLIDDGKSSVIFSIIF